MHCYKHGTKISRKKGKKENLKEEKKRCKQELFNISLQHRVPM